MVPVGVVGTVVGVVGTVRVEADSWAVDIVEGLGYTREVPSFAWLVHICEALDLLVYLLDGHCHVSDQVLIGA